MGLFSFFRRQEPKYYQKDGNHWYIFNSAIDDLSFTRLNAVYEAVPHLRAVIDKKAELFSNGIVELVDIDSSGNETVNTTHPLAKVLEKPNYMQPMKSLMYMVMVYKSISGDAFLRPVFKVGKEARNLSKIWAIAFNDFKVHTHKKNIISTREAGEFIKHYEFWTDPDQHFTYEPDKIIHIRDYGTSYTEGISKVTSLKEPIQNIYKALKSRGVLAARQGGIGILSKDARGVQFDMPLMKDDKDEMQRAVNKVKLDGDKGAIHVTDIPMKWQSMVYPTKDLMLFEEIQDDFNIICDTFGLPRELFDGETNFSNKEHAQRGAYQDTIIPEWQDFADTLTNNLGLLDEKKRVRVNYDHIQVLQTDKKQDEETKKLKHERLIEEYREGLITAEQYNEQMYEG